MSESISLEVTGMKCAGCESNATQKLEETIGVIQANAFHKENKIDVSFDENKTNQAAIEAVITAAGYKVV